MKRLIFIAVLLAVAWSDWGWAGLAAGLAVVFAVWWLSLLMWPNRPCFWCKGTGRNFGSNKKRWGVCWFCKGRPRRRRGARKRK